MDIERLANKKLNIESLSLDGISISNLSIAKVRKLINFLPTEKLKILLELVELDDRKGIRTLGNNILRKLKEEEARKNRRTLLLKQENKLWAEGYRWVAGLDEAGRGPLAGPVVAACVVFSPGTYIEGVDDSKKLSPKKRDELFDIIMDKAEAVGIGRIDPKKIDRINILNATRQAMEEAVSKCHPNIDFLLVDAMEGQFSVPYASIIKGDLNSHSIAAASIIAKVTRDREMLKWHEEYPQYGFNSHKGYGTAGHREAIQTLGLCPIHRQTFTQRLGG